MAVFASLWLLCVGVVGTLAWYAIDSAGKTTQVLASENRSASPRPASGEASTTSAARPTSEPAEPSTPDEPSSSSTTTSGSADDSSSSSTTSASSSSPARATSGTPARTTSTTREARRPSSTRTSRTPSTPSSSTSSAQTLLRSTPGGSVTVTCRRDEPIDYVARPAEGWGVRTNTQGSTEADIRFTDGGETWEVHAKCSDGEPSASVDHKSNDD